MTRAPMSAKWRTAVGPARTRDASMMVKRDSGPARVWLGWTWCVSIRLGVNIGTAWPPSLGLKTTFTRWPIASGRGSQSTRLVIIVTPSSSVTKAIV